MAYRPLTVTWRCEMRKHSLVSGNSSAKELFPLLFLGESIKNYLCETDFPSIIITFNENNCSSQFI